MRLRNIPGADEAIAQSPYCIQDAAAYTGKWHTLFPQKAPLHIEIGMGKGQFIMGMAKAHTDINYIGIEKYTSVLLRAVQKMEAEETPLDTLRFLCFNAEDIAEIFAPGEVDRIYLNFSDPWPKKRHAKRRLTSSAFLDVYRRLLKKDGVIEFKTDNRGLFEYSLQSVTENNYHLDYVSLDLHNSPEANDNIMTEYERKFSVNGPIYKMIISDCKE